MYARWVDECALLPCQRRWFYDRSSIKVAAKSRQIGFTWTTAAEAVEVAATAEEDGGMPVYFMTTSLEDARIFIQDCAQWILWFTPMIQSLAECSDIIEDEDWFTDDNDAAILAFRIDFASGNSIFALATRPAKMRGKKRCYAILDEAAQADVKAWRTAAAGSVMWGGRLAIISTYFGTDNDFYRLVETAKDDEGIGLHEVDIYQALDEGLYKIMCRKARRPWSPEAEAAWVEWLRTTLYPDGLFAQECECIPEGGKGQKIPRAVVERCLTLGPDKCTIFEACGGEHPTVWLNEEVVGRSATSWETKDADAAEVKERLNTMRQWLEVHVAPSLARINREGHAQFVGLDYGRTVNLSVFTVAIVRRSRVREARLIIELENMPWPEQHLVQDFLWAGLDNLQGGAADKGGNGEPAAEDAQTKTRGVVRATKIGSGWHNPKFTAVERRLLEQAWLLPRHHEALVGDLTSLRTAKGKIVAPQRTTKGARKQKRHADGAFALALCEQAMSMDGPAILPEPPTKRVRRIRRTRR